MVLSLFVGRQIFSWLGLIKFSKSLAYTWAPITLEAIFSCFTGFYELQKIHDHCYERIQLKTKTIINGHLVLGLLIVLFFTLWYLILEAMSRKTSFNYLRWWWGHFDWWITLTQIVQCVLNFILFCNNLASLLQLIYNKIHQVQLDVMQSAFKFTDAMFAEAMDMIYYALVCTGLLCLGVIAYRVMYEEDFRVMFQIQAGLSRRGRRG